MTRVRARWVIGLGLVISGAAISCGSGDSAGLFTMSTAGAGMGLGSSGASNQAGAPNVAGDDGGGAFNQSGGAGAGDTSGAPGAGMSSTGGGGSGAPAGGAMGSAGKGGTSGKAGSGGGGAGGKSGGGGTAGAPSGGGGAGGAMAGAAGTGGTSGGSGSGGTAGSGGSGPVSCSDNAGCGESQYCAKADCSSGQTGTCTARPIDCSGTAETAMCGCDGFTYHDACLMHLNSQNSFAAGACSKVGIGSGTAVTCSAANDAACTVKGGVCGFRADTACPGTLPLKGICWVLPATCPLTAAVSKAAEVCNPIQQGPNSFCESECTAVKSQVRYALSVMCN